MPVKWGNLKVYGAQTFVRNLDSKDGYEQARVIIAAPNKTAAAHAFGLDNLYQFNNACCGSETGNAEEIALAMKAPGTVYAASMQGGKAQFHECVLVTNCLRVVKGKR